MSCAASPIDLLDTYVGPRTGQRIIEGRVDRGAVEMIEAAIWFSDLRGFTLLSEQSPIPEVLAHLNAWFGIIGEVVEVHGGEVLKFIGDAVLAIFPTSDEQDRSGSLPEGSGGRAGVRPEDRRRKRPAPIGGYLSFGPWPGPACRRGGLRECRSPASAGFHGHRPGGEPGQPAPGPGQAARPASARFGSPCAGGQASPWSIWGATSCETSRARSGSLHCPTKAVLDRTNRHAKASPSAQYLLTEPTFHSLLDRLLCVKPGNSLSLRHAWFSLRKQMIYFRVRLTR